MDILFSGKLGEVMNPQKKLQRAHGEVRAKLISRRLDQLMAAPSLLTMRSLPGRTHELTGDRRGTLSIDLDGPYRLIFEPAHEGCQARRTVAWIGPGYPRFVFSVWRTLMTRAPMNEYRPDTVTRPGETLEEVLAEQGVTQADLADRTGRPRKTINEIIKGKAAITPETALQFERVLGVPAAFWNNLESNFREFLARHDEEEQLIGSASWLEKVPVADMVRLGWTAKQTTQVGRLREVLGFFGIASPDQWEAVFATPQANFRLATSTRCETGALAAWLRKGELEARRVECASFDPVRFKAALVQARAGTKQPIDTALPQLVKSCAASGVAVVFVPHLPACPVHGAARWLSPTRALIQLSLRYQSDDLLWFTFFHEAAHLLLHGKREVFVDDASLAGQEWEEEANRHASEFLIPESALAPLSRMGRKNRISRDQVLALATRAGVAPGIAVGRLQHEGWLPRTHLNGLKRHLDWGSVSTTLVASAARSEQS